MAKLSRSKEKMNATLGNLIVARYTQAASSNSDAHRRCQRCLDLMKGQIDSVPVDPEDDEIEVAMNITGPITRNVHAQVEEVLDPILEQPFVLETDPVAQLPAPVQDELINAIETNIQRIIEMTGGDESLFTNLLKNMSQTALTFYNEAAKTAANNLYPVVLQKLKLANFKTEFSQWLYNYVAYPLAILKGPVYETRKMKVWDGMAMVYQDQMVHRVYNISPFNIFPSPNAKDLQSCEYVIERQRLTSSELLDMSGTVSFDAESIFYVLQDHEKYILPYEATGSEIEPDALGDSGIGSVSDLSWIGIYDVLIHYGRIQGAKLKEYGVDISNEYRLYESEIWVLAGTIIKCVLNPDPLGRRPFYTAAFYHLPGELWGSSIPETIEDVQIQCTTAGRALVNNMDFSAGPLGEVDTARVKGEGDPTEIYPRKITPVKQDSFSQNAPAYRFYTIPSLAGELWSIFDKAHASAYELIGIPRLAFGQTQGAATIGRTSGGVSMMLNQASKAIKQPLLYAENHVIEPIIQRFVDIELQFNPNPSLKGDVNVRASGVRGMQEKEKQQGNLTWVLQSLAPFARGFEVPPAFIMRILEQLLSQMGVDTKGLPNIALQDAMNQDQGIIASLTGMTDNVGAAQSGTIEGAPAMNNSDYTQPLDGRSAQAIQTINQMNHSLGG
ncbi:hypothetical protein [Xenorhabdus sp. KK7.4]|uniref:hypothetical protein n=1 Tax=Xenorhabdus sp. KK7.4 TaxID=1851572 RepID=UPI000C04CB95|nr:hypothetical protein [Xenorhabdus sp. KK7.4]PHM52086.1 hypothetical protein Xekk_03311 [Xenorhabdus sp. KK7.4]